METTIISRLLESDEPSIRYKTLTRVLGVDPDDSRARAVQSQIPGCERVQKLLSARRLDGSKPFHPYAKWQGAHWVLSLLADLGYPPSDESLVPLREHVLGWLLSPHHWKGIKTIAGKVRRCASQESNALYSLLTLGLADERCDELAERLIRWQWPDGGWNCDKDPEAQNSSYHESWIPLRALALHAQVSGSQASTRAAERAAEVFLKRRLFRRLSDGEVIDAEFIRLHYPPYWHYDLLAGLKVMAEAGFIADERCGDALGLLESKRLPDGGFPAEAKYYRVTDRPVSGRSTVNWGVTSATRSNEFVTVDALYVLKQAGRLVTP
jgi:hypothetical protein